MEKNTKKKNVYVCITKSLCYTAEINTTFKINYISILKKKTNRMDDSNKKNKIE